MTSPAASTGTGATAAPASSSPLAAVPPTPRGRLALVAADAARAVPGVAGLAASAGARWATAVPGGVVEGVRCTAAGPSAYDLAIGIVARPEPLAALGAAVREAVVAAIADAGLSAELGRVDVHVAGLEP